MFGQVVMSYDARRSPLKTLDRIVYSLGQCILSSLLEECKAGTVMTKLTRSQALALSTPAASTHEQLHLFMLESRGLGALVFLHLGLAFLLELARGRGLKEIGRSFLCSKSPACLPTCRTRSGNLVKVQYKIEGLCIKDMA